jgi:3-deoxy-D-manno-octulosonic acid (KDO) 8-phosphate synthase
MNTANTFTEKEFYTEICRFREHLGNSEWWQKPQEIRDACVRGLSFVYFNVVNDDGSLPNKSQIDKWGAIFDATISEYSRRESFMI